jgi:hypothetical protein
MTSKLPSFPFALESDATLPPDIRAMANLRNRVIAWTALDPNHDAEVDGYVCSRKFGIFLLPCLWPYLILCLPCGLAEMAKTTNMIRCQYWILTETELKIVIPSHDAICIPGYFETGDSVKTIPLENITDCGISARARGLVNECAGSLPEIYVDTASTQGKSHEATGISLAGYERFVQAVLNQRDIVKCLAIPPSDGTLVAATAFATYPTMERGNDRTSAERIMEITCLYESRVLTKDEFDEKRREIIDLI